MLVGIKVSFLEKENIWVVAGYRVSEVNQVAPKVLDVEGEEGEGPVGSGSWARGRRGEEGGKSIERFVLLVS